VIADCKLVNTELITALNGMGMGFVSKLPSSFSGKIRDSIIDSIAEKTMTESSVKGYSTFETKSETVCGELRSIAFKSPKGIGKAMEYSEKQGKKDAEKRFGMFSKKEFECEADAVKMFNEVLAKHKDSAYVVTGKTVKTETKELRKMRGRPPKDSEEPITKTVYKIAVSMEFDTDTAIKLAEKRGTSVIVTNLPYASEDAANVRHGGTTDTVLRLYLDQYKVEHTYRLMKSGMGVDEVYVRTPSRANALLFVVAVATLISSVIDALLKRNGKGRYKTVKQACIEIQNAILEYHRGTDEISVLGPAGSEEPVFAYMDAIGMDPSLLLERLNG
jgi:transposase